MVSLNVVHWIAMITAMLAPRKANKMMAATPEPLAPTSASPPEDSYTNNKANYPNRKFTFFCHIVDLY